MSDADQKGQISGQDILDIQQAKSVDHSFDVLCQKLLPYGLDRLLYGATRFSSITKPAKDTISQYKQKFKIDFEEKSDDIVISIDGGRETLTLGYAEDFIHLSNHEESYLNAYLGKRLFFGSPVFIWALLNTGAKIWPDTDSAQINRNLTPEYRRVIELNAQYGLNAGVTISFPKTAPNTHAALAISARPGMTKLELESIWKKHSVEINALCSVFHNVVALSPPPREFKRNLTDHQLKTLKLAANGLKAVDIAKKMNVSTKTVEKHLSEARTRLGVRTTNEAVMKATLLNLINR